MGAAVRSPTFWVFVCGVLVAGALALIGGLKAEEFDAWGELGKAGIELGVVAVGGALLTAIITTRQAAREDQLRQSEKFRRSLLDDVTKAYSGLKEARRALRAAGLQNPSGTLTAGQAEAFSTQMSSINAIQLSLERCLDSIDNQHDVLPDSALLVPGLDQLTEYVKTLVDEWERDGRAIAAGADAARVAGLHALQRFLAPARTQDGFKTNASVPAALLMSELGRLRPATPGRPIRADEAGG